MMKNDQLRDQLKDLFSDMTIPDPATAPDYPPADVKPAQSPRPGPEKEQQPEPVEPVQEPHPELEQEPTTQQQALERQIELLQQTNYQLQKRAIHLQASTAVSRAMTSILDPQELMQSTVNLIRERFNFYHVSFFLLDETGEWAVVRASTGDIGRQMVAQPHRLAIGGVSMVGWACAHRQPRIALDVGADAIHFDNPLLPNTRSEMALPLIIGERLLGALNVQSTEEAAFDDDDVRTLQGMADLVAVAMENARLFAETQQRAQRQHLITRITDHLQRATSIDDILALTVKDLGQAFDLAQATICLGIEDEILAAGNGHSHKERETE